MELGTLFPARLLILRFLHEFLHCILQFLAPHALEADEVPVVQDPNRGITGDVPVTLNSAAVRTAIPPRRPTQPFSGNRLADGIPVVVAVNPQERERPVFE